jgi:regulatory protein
MGDGEEKGLIRAKNAAYRYLALRPRSRGELEGKLRDKGFAEELVRNVLDDLARFGYIDDARFSCQWADARVRLRHFGRRRIERELIEKGVGREIVEAALDGCIDGQREFETARSAAEKKYPALRGLDRETRLRRLSGLLERKGFSFGVIRDVVRVLESQQPRATYQDAGE